MKVAIAGLLLAATGCIGQLSNVGGAHPSTVGSTTSREIDNCKHIRKLHDLFSISTAGLSFASGASGLSTIVVGSSGGKTAFAITSVVLGIFGAVAAKGTAIETTNYANTYTSQGGCSALLGNLESE
jgi:hypothetical protein